MKKPTAIFLKYRWLIIVFILTDIAIRSTFYRNLIESSDEICDIIKIIFVDSPVINNIFANLTIIISRDFCLLYESSFSALCFTLLLIVFLSFRSKGTAHKYTSVQYRLFEVLAITTVSFIYFFVITILDSYTSIMLFSLVLTIYFIDFNLFDCKQIYKKSFLKNIFFVFFTVFIFISEILFLPIFIKFLQSLKYGYVKSNRLNNIRFIHFGFMVFIPTLLFSPINSTKIKPMRLLSAGNYYGIAYSKNEEKLFALNQGKQQLEVFSFNGSNKPKIIYKFDLPYTDYWQIGHFVNLNDNRKELYLTDREKNELVVLDTRDYSIKNKVKSKLFNFGDSFLDSANNNVYGVTEDNMCVYNIAIKQNSLNMLSKCFIDGEGSTLSANATKKHLYVFNGKTPSHKYSLYVINSDNLNIIKKIPVPYAGHIQVSNDGQTLYYNASNEVKILNADTFEVIDRVPLPFTTNYAALDYERQLFFAGNFFTGIISVIDLKSKKTIQYHKCSNFYTRIITLDKKNRRFFVTTHSRGVCSGDY